MLKNLLDLPGIHQFKDLTEDKCRKVLVQAICNILLNCKESSVFRCVTLARADVEKAQEAAEMEATEEEAHSEEVQVERMDTSLVNEERGSVDDEISVDEFHERLIITNYETIEEVEKFFVDNYEVLSNRCGVLLFLYSVLFTKGIESLLSEIGDTSEPLIHQNFGYGSQSLINLFLTGRAVAHVFDNDQDIGGMKLKGIDRQSDIGFITLMEQMRYCTVGSFFKNPKYPIWIVASETHLTVLFSNEKSLVSPETPAENARRIFAHYDTENTGFISSAVLQDVMSALGLESDPDYVEIMRKKLDPDSTSIILLSDFMYEFFPEDKKSTPDTFNLFHYNGILSSNDNHKVRYSQGNAILLESHTTEMFSMSNQMLTVLQTKWPNIEVNWLQDRVPSLN
jgi:ubiquitin carboxyl-terminal hydrolase MINDY-3/4